MALTLILETKMAIQQEHKIIIIQVIIVIIITIIILPKNQFKTKNKGMLRIKTKIRKNKEIKENDSLIIFVRQIKSSQK